MSSITCRSQGTTPAVSCLKNPFFPLAIDLYCGLGGWTEGFLHEGYNVIGFDIERHVYPRYSHVSDGEGTKTPGNNSANRWADRPIQRLKDARGAIEPGTREYPGQLVLQDVLTLHGSQFKDAAVIVASPPCQAYSYRAMPWKRAKALPPPDNTLFAACFRIQREANAIAGYGCPSCGGKGFVVCAVGDTPPCERCHGKGYIPRYIPLVVENVCGAQPWVGRAAWHYGSFYLWGDVPALMPLPSTFRKSSSSCREVLWKNRQVPRFNDGESLLKGGQKVAAYIHQRNGHTHTRHLTNPTEHGRKFGGEWWHDSTNNLIRKASSRSIARKVASAHIAKIPFELARHIARVYKPFDFREEGVSKGQETVEVSSPCAQPNNPRGQR